MVWLGLLTVVGLVFAGSPAMAADVPSQPSAPKVALQADSLAVTWTAPDGLAPTSYRVEVAVSPPEVFAAPPAGDCSAPVLAPLLSCTAAGLTPGTTYVVRVIALIDTSESAPSEPSAPIQFVTVPAEPVVSVTSGPAALNVTWKQVATGGSPITSFRVQLSRSAAGVYTIPARGTCEGALLNRTCRITGLIEGATYYVRVRAISRVGAGPWGLSKPIRTLARPDIRLAFGGDVHFEGAASAQAGAGGLRTLPQIFAGADVSMVNLETAIATSASSPVSKEYNFRAPAKVLSTLAAAGVDVVTEANNHSIDFGASGLRTTLNARAHSPIPVVGIGVNTADAIKPWVTEVKGTSIAVFGMVGLDLTYEENAAVARTWPATPTSPGIAVWRNHSTQLLAAVAAWAKKVDVVVVYAHWGKELATCPDAAQRREAALLSKAGASVIIGAHPHVLQGSGWMGHSVVAYSLGNFAWYSTAGRPTGAFLVQVSHGKPSNFSWRPTTYTGSGLPILVKGSAAADTRALLAERSAPGCSGLTAKPGARLALTVRPCTSSLRPSERAVPGFE